MFVATNKHVAPLDRIEHALDDHLAWLERHRADGKVLAYGVVGTKDGGFALFSGVDEAQLLAILEEDPFRQRGLVEYDYFEAQVVGGVAALKDR